MQLLIRSDTPPNPEELLAMGSLLHARPSTITSFMLVASFLGLLTSPLPVLAELGDSPFVTLARAPAKKAPGPLRVHPTNPRYFTGGSQNADGSLKVVYLTGSHTWNNQQEIEGFHAARSPDPLTGKFDFERFLNFLDSHHHNFYRHWLFEFARDSNPQWGPVTVAPHPWPRTGPGQARDGKPKFDLSKFDESYFNRLRSRLASAEGRGIYAAVMLFESSFSASAWPGHPFHPDNNVNGVDGGSMVRFHTLESAAVVRLQEAYVRQVVDTVNDLDNVLYDVCNEPGQESWDWCVHFCKCIKQYQATKPQQHPVGLAALADKSQSWVARNDQLYDSPFDWISPGGWAKNPPANVNEWATDPPAGDGQKVILVDTDHGIWPKPPQPGWGRGWVWKCFARGHQPILMDWYDSPPVMISSQEQEELRKAMGHTRRYADRMNLAAMMPHGELASTRYCLAHPGQEYLIYLPDGGEVTVDLSAAKGPLAVEWFNPRLGAATDGGLIEGGAKRSLRAAFEGDAALYLTAEGKTQAKQATLDEVLAAKQDLWGLAAMRQTNGASYEFFAGLLPPLRYVNARFRHYPLVLGAPGATAKARLVSNGSAINARANLRTWHEVGTPVSFFVGDQKRAFGENLRTLEGPRYERGYLPIVHLSDRAGAATYTQETFAGVDWTDNAVVFVRFRLKDGEHGVVTAEIETDAALKAAGNALCDEQGRALLSFDRAWQWDAGRRTLTAQLSARGEATLAIATLPMAAAANQSLPASDFDVEKQKCMARWEAILADAMRVEVPEPRVNAAWKSTILGSFLLLRGDKMNYSAGNQYQTMYEAESGDAVRALLLWGLNDDARRMIPPLLDFGVNPGLRFHDAAFKLQLLAHCFWLTRDTQFIRELSPQWSRCVELLTGERDHATGLLPRESYCGDEHDKVFSLNSNANAWRGLRDLAAVLEHSGQPGEAAKIRTAADALRRAVLAAVAKSERRDVQPPFIPIALFGEEQPYDVLTSTRRGSYWNLMIPYVIGSGIFNGSQRDGWPLRYLEEHGGVSMGMIRFHQHSRLFANEDGLDDLYGLRYVDALLRRDEPERAVASFYGKLAQGMTRDTFLSAEGTGLRPLDEFGRPMYLPPTCSGNALLLWTLRSLLVQDFDLDNDGQPETLRLLFATPRRWLEDGKTIRVERAPTAFGEVSVRVESKLSQGEVMASVELPQRNPAKQTLLRIRLPEGWRAASAKAGSQELSVDAKGTVDLSGLEQQNTIRFQVRRD